MSHTLPARPGRRRDPARDGQILDAAVSVLAETGYERMTIDAVAARAGAARATVYRRWATKADLVVDAIGHLSATDIDVAALPDTGTLRGDLIASVSPHSPDEQELRIRVMTGVLVVAATEPRLAKAATGAGAEPWIAAGRFLIQRAIDRGEYAAADVEALAQVMPLMCIARVAVQGLPITRDFSLGLIDGLIIPALRGRA